MNDWNKLPADVAALLGSTEEVLLGLDFPIWPETRQICLHALTGGKRIRPQLLLLTGCALNADRQQCVQLAAAVEVIHAATLVHDDVIDDATERRNRPTINQQWGIKRGILAGDLLYAHAFALISAQKLPTVRIQLAEVACALAESEFLQLENKDFATISADFAAAEERYFQIIDGKTASLFRFCAQAPALHCEAQEPVTEALKEFGTCFGLAFQLTDDALDCDSSADNTGKITGTDLRDGNFTLTIARALQQADAKGRREIEAGLRAGSEIDRRLPRALRAIDATDAVQYTRRCAEKYVRKAIDSLSILPASPYRHHLEALTQALIHRQQ